MVGALSVCGVPCVCVRACVCSCACLLQLGTREVVVAGDMNTEMLAGSCVAALLTPADDDSGGGGGGSQQAVASPAQAHAQAQAQAVGAEAAAAEVEQLLVRECASALRLQEGHPPTAEEMRAWRVLHTSAAAAPQDTRIGLRRVFITPPTHHALPPRTDLAAAPAV